MGKKLLCMLLAISTLAVLLTGCGAWGEPGQNNAEVAANGKKVGVTMPNQTVERWTNDGNNIKSQLEALGYEVDLRYADDDIPTQVSQIEEMIAEGVDCLVISSIDAYEWEQVETQAKDAGIPVIAYDRLLKDTDAVSYYATFDNKGVGVAIGEYIEEKKNLANTSGTYTIEFFMGSPDDNNSHMIYDGLMEVLQPYLDTGTLVCKSGRTSFDDSCIVRWSEETAREYCADYLANFYADEQLDICATAFDGFAYGCKTALEEAGYTADNWPLITGQDAELIAVKNVIAGTQAMTIYKDTRLLAGKCVTMVQAVLEGRKPEINDTEQYDNGALIVPSYLCMPVVVDADNYEDVIIGGGYYTKGQLEN